MVIAWAIACRQDPVPSDPPSSAPPPTLPAVPEACGNGVDDDGDGLVDCADPDCASASACDVDGDGFAVIVGGDCDDADPAIDPGALETCEDAVDQNCDGNDANCLTGGVFALAGAEAKIIGEPGNYLGTVIAGAGDVDDDGFDDVLVATSGYAYLVRGTLTGRVHLGDADARLSGDGLGIRSIAGPGDVDGDGFDDLLIGVPFADDSTGAVYLMSGPVAGFRRASDATATLAVHGAAFDDTGREVTGAGDVDGDGHPDLLFSDPDQRAVFLVSGARTGSLALADADARFESDTGYTSTGRALAGPGDTDGDGLADVLVGAPWPGYYGDTGDLGPIGTGNAYVFFGPASGTRVVSEADRVMAGESNNSGAGAAVTAGGDVDGDGLADLLVSAPNEGPAGVVYVVHGGPGGETPLAEADGRVVGSLDGPNEISWVFASAGDVDADGFDDLILGAPTNSDAFVLAGAAYLVRGPVRGSLSAPDADVIFRGQTGDDRLGGGVASAGDVDGDGGADLLLGAERYGEIRTELGAVYVVVGASL